MEKTLWMLSYKDGTVWRLVPLYAQTLQDAWNEARLWAVEKKIVLREDATINHFPCGFTLYRRVIPGVEPGSSKG